MLEHIYVLKKICSIGGNSKLKVADLKKEPIISDWLKHVRAKPNTAKGYYQAMQEYTEYTGMTPNKLIDEAEDEIEKQVKPRKQKLKGYMIGFREYLEKKGLAPLSIEGRITGVRSFYKANDIIIPELQRNEKTAMPLECHKKIPDKETIRLILTVADPLEKAIILTGAASGLSMNEITDLKISDFRNGLDTLTGVTTLDLRREKKQVDFVTFLTPEATNAILKYLEFRERKLKTQEGEYRRKQLAKQKIYDDTGYLFVGRHISDEYLESYNEELRKLTAQGVMSLYRKLCEDTQLSADKGIRNVMRSHNLRKFFNNRLIAANCDPMLREFMMGHRISDRTKSAYFVADSTVLKELYKKLIPYLTIEKTLDVAESPEYKRLKEENSVLAAETAKRVIEHSELQELRKEIEKLKMQNDFTEMLLSSNPMNIPSEYRNAVAAFKQTLAENKEEEADQ